MLSPQTSGMQGISNLTVREFQARILRFDQRYVVDWTLWLERQPHETAELFGMILRKWQACRPNLMRRTRRENLHTGPYLECLIEEASPYIHALQEFDIRSEATFTLQMHDACTQLWAIFRNLSYAGRSREGLSGIVGISKAVLLLTNGRIGPAFDSQVRLRLGVGNIVDASAWVRALRTVSQDVGVFEMRNQTTLQDAAPAGYSALRNGRLYDMALGPGGQPTEFGQKV